MEMKDLKKGMVVLAKSDSEIGQLTYYIEWFQEILKKSIRLTVVSEAKYPNYDSCMVISDRGEHKGIPFELRRDELRRVISANYRRF